MLQPDWALAKATEIVQGFIDQQIQSVIAEIQSASAVDLTSLHEFYTSLVSESDRGLAIVLFAFIDDAMKSIYSSVLNEDVDGGLETLVGIAGPLSSAGLRIHMATRFSGLNVKRIEAFGRCRKSETPLLISYAWAVSNRHRFAVLWIQCGL